MKLSSTAILALAISSVTATAYAEPQSQATPRLLEREKRSKRGHWLYRRPVDGRHHVTGTPTSNCNAVASSSTRRTAFRPRPTAGSTGFRAPSSSTTRASPKAPSVSALKWRPTTPSHWIGTARPGLKTAAHRDPGRPQRRCRQGQWSKMGLANVKAVSPTPP
jgi:hypothetical protein